MIKMEQKRRIKGGNEKDTKIGIAIAAIILASVFAATVPVVSAESRSDNFNHIVVQQTPQKVLIGQNLQFEGFDGTVAIYRMVSGDIENVYQTDANNRIYNVNWPKSGNYYVNYDSATKDYEAPLSVEEQDMPLSLKVGTWEATSIAVGTKLTIDTGGMNLFNNDQVDLVIKGPDGQIKYDDVNRQNFTDITVADLNDWYGDNNLETTGWTIGAYTFKVETDDVNACGLEAESVVRPLLIVKGEIAIEADMTSTVELDTVKLIVTGVAGDEINVAASPLSDDVVFKAGIDDTPMDATNQFYHTIDADGTRKYAVEFTDTGSYTIEVTVTGPAEIGGIANPRVGDSDTVDITVLEKEVVFDLPSTVVIGEKIEIKGTATSGTYVSIYIDDKMYPKLENIVLVMGEFSQEVRTTDVGMNIRGTVRLKAWIDCPTKAGEERPARSPDGEDAILLTTPLLTAELSSDAVVLEDDFTVSGTAQGATEVTILSIPPKGGGGKSLLDKGETGLSLRKASVSTTDYTYSKKLTVQEDATTGYYDEYVLTAGMDGYWGMTGEQGLDAAFEKKYSVTELSGPSIATKTQAQIQAILEDMIYAPGSDDLMVKLRLKVEPAYVRLGSIANVAEGDLLVITGTSNRQDGYAIILTCEGLLERDLFHHTVQIENGTFSATFDTTNAAPDEYTVKADDGDGHTDERIVTLEKAYVKLDSIPSVTAGEKLVVTGTSNRQEGFAINVTCEGPAEIPSKTVKVYNNAFRATFDTTDAESGTYTVKADDGDKHIDKTNVTIKPTPTPTPTPTAKPIPIPAPAPPGFEAIFAIAGLLAVAYLVHRRK